MKKHEFHEHFPDDIEPKLRDYITNQVMDWSRYLITNREGRKQWAHCTSCGEEFPPDKTLKHGTREVCVHCGQEGKVLASGRGRKRLFDTAYLLWYERSQADPDALIARGFYCSRDYTGDYRRTRTEVKQIARYLFRWGKGGIKMHRPYWRGEEWYSQKSVTSETRGSMRQVMSYHMPADEIAKVVKGTPWQYCTWDKYHYNDYVEVFELTSRYQCIEFLTKAGFNSFVSQKLCGGSTYGAINWLGKTPAKVLRLSNVEIKELAKKDSISLQTLRSYQVTKAEGLNFSYEEAQAISDLVDPRVAAEFRGALHTLKGRLSSGDLKRYILKQMRKNRTSFYNARAVLINYRDYLGECEKLGLDITRPGVYLPNNLHEAHRSTTKRVQAIANQQYQENVRKRKEELEKMRFQYKELILFPAPSTNALVNEGKVLEHCVADYARDYARGTTDLFFVRRKSDPDKPFYTLEVQNEEVRQCRGFDNCDMTPEVEEFIERFKKDKLAKKKRSTKSNKPQGVAV
ncbi:PcfJ domain-containing protein [Paenibacillus sp. 22594]|uniref:PcfJ domain-containing protein n=1 Tax=Paenibacillus sp. 22594 TaxID=3453947 RepID=UPI003F836E37